MMKLERGLERKKIVYILLWEDVGFLQGELKTKQNTDHSQITPITVPLWPPPQGGMYTSSGKYVPPRGASPSNIHIGTKSSCHILMPNW